MGKETVLIVSQLLLLNKKYMEIIQKKAYAKINLNLEVIRKRPDNYHDIESIFQRISLHDDITITKSSIPLFDLNCNIKELENGSNILFKAFLKLQTKYHIPFGVHVDLIKRIPMQAGLGGGSADCAAFIQGMNELFELNMSQKEMEEIGASLGADVVPCMYNLVLAEGIGDIITPLSSKLNYNLLIIKPHFTCSTKEMYENLDPLLEKKLHSRTTKDIIDILENNKPITLFHNLLYNSFEEVLKDNYEIQVIKQGIIRFQGICPLLCGSGSCMFGIFPDENDLDKAYEYFKNTFNYEVFKVRTMN